MTKSSKLNYNYSFYYFFLHRYDIVRFVWTLVLVGWFCIRIQMAKLNKMYSSSRQFKTKERRKTVRKKLLNPKDLT